MEDSQHKALAFSRPEAQTPEAEVSTEEVVRRLQQGLNPEEGFRYLFNRYYWPLFRIFRRRGFSDEESRDLVQDVFVGLHQSIASFRWEAPFEAWLIGLAKNTGRKRVRRAVQKNRRETPLDERDHDGLAVRTSDDPLNDLLSQERGDRLREALAELPRRMGACVRLRIERELSYAQIAEVLQMAEATVKVHMFEARKRLKTLLS
ncbi:MAG: sigma-70 family RNA polymerase sigma factor [Acidobacteriota bacterium]